MKVLNEVYNNDFDLFIMGLGYESRSTYIFNNKNTNNMEILAVGYDVNKESYSYPKNKDLLINEKVKIIEGNEDLNIKSVLLWLQSKIIDNNIPIKILLDITVFNRSRLASIILLLIDNLPKGSILTISYSLSNFVSPPEGLTPIRVVGEITPKLIGDIGSLRLPTSLVVGLGYEEGKALGLINLIEADINYLFIPKGTDFKFDEYVLENNTTLINETQKKNIINYPLEDPLSTYIDLKDLVLSLSSFSCPLLAPLGPKMFAAICVIISKEFDEKIPVWRVSSELTEKPMEREASGNILSLSIKI